MMWLREERNLNWGDPKRRSVLARESNPGEINDRVLVVVEVEEGKHF